MGLTIPKALALGWRGPFPKNSADLHRMAFGPSFRPVDTTLAPEGDTIFARLNELATLNPSAYADLLSEFDLEDSTGVGLLEPDELQALADRVRELLDIERKKVSESGYGRMLRAAVRKIKSRAAFENMDVSKYYAKK